MNFKVDINIVAHIYNGLPSIEKKLDSILAAMDIERAVAKETKDLKESTDSLNDAILRNTPK